MIPTLSVGARRFAMTQPLRSVLFRPEVLRNTYALRVMTLLSLGVDLQTRRQLQWTHPGPHRI